MAAADSAPAWQGFLPSSSPSDAQSNSLLRTTWPLLAACPFVRYMYLKELGFELDAPAVKKLKKACQFINNMLIWTLPFTEPGPQHSAIRASLPGLSGFSRIAARTARWCAFATALMARAAAKGAPVSAETSRIAVMTFVLVTCLEKWQEVSVAFGQGPRSHARCGTRRYSVQPVLRRRLVVAWVRTAWHVQQQ